MKKRPRCELIPVSEFDGAPQQQVIFEDNTHHVYHKSLKGRKEHYVKATRKSCSECGKTAIFVGIFTYKKHQRVERFCEEHAAAVASSGELPIPNPDLEIKLKPK